MSQVLSVKSKHNLVETSALPCGDNRSYNKEQELNNIKHVAQIHAGKFLHHTRIKTRNCLGGIKCINQSKILLWTSVLHQCFYYIFTDAGLVCSVNDLPKYDIKKGGAEDDD